MTLLRSWSWKPAPDYRRLVKALWRQGDPGYVPFLELFADPEMVTAVLGEPPVPAELLVDRTMRGRALDRGIRFWYRLGYDAFWLGAGVPWPDLKRRDSEDTAALSRGQRRWVDEHTGVIASWADYERYPWPRMADVDLFPLEYVARHLPEGMAIVGQITGILEPVMWLMGYEAFALAIYEQPDLVEAMFSRVAEIAVPLARTLAQMDRVVALWMGDDMGFKTGTMIAPEHLRRYVFPIQKQIAAAAHERGLPFLLHSCGNLDAVMDDLIDDVQIDAKHSFEDVIEPVDVFSARYGSRVSVIGGVDVDLLCRGSEEQVRARTRTILQECTGSRGYILGSGNSIANYIPPRSYLAMLDEGWRFRSQGL